MPQKKQPNLEDLYSQIGYRMLEDLSASEKKYRELIEDLKDVVFQCDAKYRFTFLSSVWTKMLGFSVENSLGKSIIDYLHPDCKSKWHDFVVDFKEQNFEGSFTELCFIAKDGQELWCEISIKIKSSHEFTGLLHNVTFRKEMEQDKKQLEERLARSQKMEALGLLAGGVAHDLNNILLGVVTYPDMILMDLPEDSPLRESIETIKESGEKAAAIVGDLVTIARGVATTKEQLNLNSIVKKYLNSPEYSNLKEKNKQVEVKTLLEPDLFEIKGSSLHIEKTLMNLITNAIEAIDKSGTVIISTMNKHVEKKIKGYDDIFPGEYAVLSVFDNGSGISKEDLQRIFEPFYSRKEMGRSGTGLGLTIVWNTVQDHNAHLNIKTSSKGTSFELFFPIIKSNGQTKTFDPKKSFIYQEFMGKGEKVVVIDDERIQREIATGILTKLGYSVNSFSSGEAAIDYLNSNRADVLVIDMIMDPGMNGSEAYEKIKMINPNQKAIIVSGFSATTEIDKARDLGAKKFIRKPYSLEAIGKAVYEELKH